MSPQTESPPPVHISTVGVWPKGSTFDAEFEPHGMCISHTPRPEHLDPSGMCTYCFRLHPMGVTR